MITASYDSDPASRILKHFFDDIYRYLVVPLGIPFRQSLTPSATGQFGCNFVVLRGNAVVETIRKRRSSCCSDNLFLLMGDRIESGIQLHQLRRRTRLWRPARSFELFDGALLCPPVGRNGAPFYLPAQPIKSEHTVPVGLGECNHFFGIVMMKVSVRACEVLLPYLNPNKIGLEDGNQGVEVCVAIPRISSQPLMNAGDHKDTGRRSCFRFRRSVKQYTSSYCRKDNSAGQDDLRSAHQIVSHQAAMAGQMTLAGVGLLGVQLHGSRLCSSCDFVCPDTMCSKTSVSQAIGSTPFSFAVWIRVIAIAQ